MEQIEEWVNYLLNDSIAMELDDCPFTLSFHIFISGIHEVYGFMLLAGEEQNAFENGKMILKPYFSCQQWVTFVHFT